MNESQQAACSSTVVMECTDGGEGCSAERTGAEALLAERETCLVEGVSAAREHHVLGGLQGAEADGALVLTRRYHRGRGRGRTLQTMNVTAALL